jgi:hypothetical protein
MSTLGAKVCWQWVLFPRRLFVVPLIIVECRRQCYHAIKNKC